MTFPAPLRTTAALAPVLAALAGCAAQPAKPDDASPRSSSGDKTAVAQVNPLLAPWSGPWGGVPPFGRFTPADLKPALEAAMAENLAEIDRIAAEPAPPSFDNTIAAMERAGHTLDRVTTAYGVYTSTMNDAEVQGIQREMSPKLAEFNQRLAGLYTKFSQNVLAEEDSQMVLLGAEADLAGLPGAVRDGAAGAAADRGKQGQWALVNTRSSVDPFLTYSTRRDLREKVWRMFVMRGDNGDAHDN